MTSSTYIQMDISEHLTRDAFVLPKESKESIQKDYTKLYGDDAVIKKYIKASSIESKAESPEQFKNQFYRLMDALKEWGNQNNCNKNQEIEYLKNRFFDEMYTGSQHPDFFEIIKENLENIWFSLSFTKDIPLTRKKQIYIQLCDYLHVCSPGLYTHIEDASHQLTTDISVERWLADLRTHIVRIYSEKHVTEHKIPEGNTIHAYNAFLINAFNSGWAPFTKVDKITENFISIVEVDEKAIINFQKHFIESYNVQTILECVTTNFHTQISHLKKELSLKEEKPDWIETNNDFSKKITQISENIGIAKENITFFDYNDNFKFIRFNAQRFKIVFMHSCKQNKKLFNELIWQYISLPCDYKYIGFENLYIPWIENNDGDPVIWENLLEDSSTLLSLFLMQTNPNQWPKIIEATIKDLRIPIRTSADLAKFLCLFPNQIHITQILTLLLKDLDNIVQNDIDIFALVNIFPKEQHWKINRILDFCNQNYFVEALKRDDIESLIKLLAIDIANLKKQIVPVLHTALREQKIQTIELLAEHKVDLNAEDKNGMTPVSLAASMGLTSVIKTLAKYEIDLHQKDAKGLTLVHHAAKHGHAKVIKQLAEYKVDIDVPCQQGCTPLHVAVQNENHEAMKELVLLNANIHKLNTEKQTPVTLASHHKMIDFCLFMLGVPLELAAEKNWNLAHIAARFGFDNIIESYKENIELEAADNEGYTPCHIALLNTNFEIVFELAKRKIDFFTSKAKTLSPFQFAAQLKLPRMLALMLLVEKNKNLSSDLLNKIIESFKNEKQWYPAHIAAQAGNSKAIATLAEYKFDINQEDKDGITPAHTACLLNHLDVIIELAKLNIDFHKTTSCGISPYENAIKNEKWQILFQMLRLPPDKFKFNSKYTGAHYAALTNNTSLIKTLAEHKLDLNPKTSDETPAYLAIDAGNTEFIQALLEYKIDLQQTYQSSPLIHIAIRKKQNEIVKLFGRHKIDLNTKDNNGLTPIEKAVELNNREIFIILAEAGAELNPKYIKDFTLAHSLVETKNLYYLQIQAMHGVDFNVPNSNGLSPFQLAINLNYYDAQFIMAGINIEKEPNAYYSLAYFYIRKNNFEAFKILTSNKEFLIDDKFVEALFTLALEYSRHPFTFYIIKKFNLQATQIHNRFFEYRATINERNKEDKTLAEYIVEQGDIDLFKKLAECKIDFTQKNKEQYTLAHIATSKNHYTMLKTLSENQIELDSPSTKGVTPAHIAVTQQNESTIKALARLNVDFFKTHLSLKSPIEIALESKKPHLLAAIFDLTFYERSHSPSLAHIAVMRNHSALIHMLAKNNINLEEKNKSDVTPAVLAMQLGHCEALTALAEHKVNLKNLTHLAVRKNKPEIIKILHHFNTSFHEFDENKFTPVDKAIQLNHTSIVTTLAECKADLTHPDKDNIRPIHYACLKKNSDVVRILAEHKVDLNCKTQTGNTPAHLAVLYGNLAILEILAEYKADLTLSNAIGLTPIDYAITNKKLDYLTVFAKNQINFNQPNNKNEIPILKAFNLNWEEGLFIMLGMDPKFAAENNISTRQIIFMKGSVELFKNYFAKSTLKIESSELIQLAIQYNRMDIFNEILRKFPFAALQNDSSLFSLMLEQKIDLDQADSLGNTALHYAIGSKKVDIVELLLRHKANPNLKNSAGKTPAHFAVTSNQVQSLKLLAEHKADLNSLDFEITTPAHYAISNLEMLTELAKHNIDFNLCELFSPSAFAISRKENNDKAGFIMLGIDPLEAEKLHWNVAHAAAVKGNVGFIKEMKKELKMTCFDFNNHTPAHLAILHSQYAVIEELISQKIDFIGNSFFYDSLIMFALNNNRLDCFAVILGLNPKIAADNDWGPAHIAVHQQHHDAIKILVENKIDFSKPDKNNETPIELAIKSNSIKALNALACCNFDFTQSSSSRKNPLVLVIEQKKWLVLAAMVQMKTDLTNQTGVHITAITNHVPLLQLLHDHQFDLNEENEEGDTPASLAIKLGHKDILTKLAEFNLDFNRVDKYGISLLEKAVRFQPQFILTLIKYKADLKKSDATHYAAATKNIEALKLLHQAGADFFAENSKRVKPIDFIIKQKLWDIFTLALNISPSFVLKNKLSVAHMAVMTKPELILKLFENNCKLARKDSSGTTPLFLAVEMHSYSAIEYLAVSGVDLNSYNKKFETALYLAVKEDDIKMLQLLSKHRADPYKPIASCYSAIHLAACKNSKAMLKLFSEYYKNALSKPSTDENLTPAYVAAEQGCHESIHTLAEFKADLNLPSQTDEYTPVHIATERNYPKVVKSLAQNGAYLNASSKKQGDTPAIIATKHFFTDVIHVLAEYKADFDLANKSGHIPLHYFIEHLKFPDEKPLLCKSNWEALILILTTMKTLKTISKTDKQFLTAHRVKLTDQFIEFVKLKPLQEQQIFLEPVYKGKNALGIFLNTPSNSFTNFFGSQARNGMTDKMFKIASAFQPEDKNAEVKTERKKLI